MSNFEKNDRVFVFTEGWGTVVACSKLPVSLSIKFDISNKIEQVDFRFASFTEYNLVTGGFSHERPRPDIKVGTPIFVWNDPADIRVKKFQRWLEGNGPFRVRTDDLYGWYNYSLDNPLNT